MFSKLMIFFSIIIILITMNSNYHFHDTYTKNHHNNLHYHHHIEVDFYDNTTQQSNFHHGEHTEYKNNIGIINSVLLVFLFTGIVFSFLLFRQTKILRYNSKIIFCRYFFTYPPPTLIRYILFHAPPNNHS